MTKSIHHSRLRQHWFWKSIVRSQCFRKSNSSTFKNLRTQIQEHSKTMSAFKDFSGLENLEKNSRTFKDFQGPVRALFNESTTTTRVHPVHVANVSRSLCGHRPLDQATNPPKLETVVLHPFYHPIQNSRLSWPCFLVTYWDGLPACRQSPIHNPAVSVAEQTKMEIIYIRLWQSSWQEVVWRREAKWTFLCHQSIADLRTACT